MQCNQNAIESARIHLVVVFSIHNQNAKTKAHKSLEYARHIELS